jgi:hypothetical protein
MAGATHKIIGSAALVAQAILIAAIIIILALAPPRMGPMLVVPLAGHPARPWLDMRHDVQLIGVGRLRGSLIVMAPRDALLPAALAHGALVLRALCSKSVSGDNQ